MAQANDRKGVLRHLWTDRIVPTLRSSGGTTGQQDSSEPTSRGSDADEPRPEGRGEADDARERILTPEEHILELLARHGGRMKQAEVVSNIDWSESTVSRKLQKLEGTGDVTRYQLGREKLVYLPGHEPAALDSPFAREEKDAPLVH